MKIGDLIIEIIVLVVGILLIFYHNSLGNALSKAQKTFFEELNLKWNIGNFYSAFIKKFILFCGICFIIAAIYAIKYFFTQLNT